jgi:hypothetical protein
MIESDTDRKNAQRATSTITIVKFPVIAVFGAKHIISNRREISREEKEDYFANYHIG